MSQGLTAAQLSAALEMAEWFMPPTPGFPTNADADPDMSVLRLVLDQFRPSMPQITAALDQAAQEETDTYLRRIRDGDTLTYELLRVLFIGRYLSCRPVWAVLGYTGRRRLPIQPGDAERDLQDGILDPVVARGKIFRPTPH